MFSTRSLLLSLLAPVAAIALVAAFAKGGAVAGSTLYQGPLSGAVATPSISSIGTIEGRLVDSTGTIFRVNCILEPHLSGSLWFGYSPTGTVTGQLVPIPGSPPIAPVDVWGAYSVDAHGAGDFHAYLTQGFGQSQALVGSLSGRFTKADKVSPVTLLSIPGDFIGEWELQL